MVQNTDLRLFSTTVCQNFNLFKRTGLTVEDIDGSNEYTHWDQAKSNEEML